jgi:hypothetical protein
VARQATLEIPVPIHFRMFLSSENNKGPFYKTTAFRLIVLLAFLQLIIALFTNTLTFTHEESMWHYIGRNWFRHGLTPYQGGIDNKSPFLYAIYGLSDWLFGINYWFPRIIGIIVQSIGIYYIYKIAYRYAWEKTNQHAEHAGLFAISIYGLSLLWRTTGGKLVSFTETYATALVIISFYKCLSATNNKHYFISGILAGLGIGCRFSAVFGTMAVFIMVLRKNWKGALLSGAGVMTGCLLMAGLIELSGIHVRDFLFYGFADNFGQGSTTDFSWEYKLDQFFNNFFNSELILFYPFIIGYILITKKLDHLLVWLLCTFIGINVLGLYARPHFKELLPAFSLTAALCLSHLTAQYKLSFKGLMIIVWICFFPKTLEPFWGLRKTFKSVIIPPKAFCDNPTTITDEEAERRLGKWIKTVTINTDLVYVAGYGARVQLYSERVSPALYFNITQNNYSKAQIYKDLENKPPALIAIPVFSSYKAWVDQDVRDYIDKLVTDQYVFENCLYGYGIFRRKSK